VSDLVERLRELERRRLRCLVEGRFEAVSEIEVSAGEDVGVVRYRSEIDIAVAGQEPGPLECWHLDVYVRDGDAWRVRWSQATEIHRREG
jgi:hypothetical protein